MEISPAIASTNHATFFRSPRVLSSELPQLPTIPWGGKGGLKATVSYDSAAVHRVFQERIPTDHIPSEWSGPRPSEPFQDIYAETPVLNASGEVLFEKRSKDFDVPSVAMVTLLKQHGGKAAAEFLDASKVAAPFTTAVGAFGGLMSWAKLGTSFGTAMGLGLAVGVGAGILLGGYIALETFKEDIAKTPASFELKWQERKVVDETYNGFTKDEWDDGLVSYRTKFDSKEIGSYFEPVLVPTMRPSAFQ